MRSFTVAVVGAAGLVFAGVVADAFAATSVVPVVPSPQSTALQPAQYYPGYHHHYWDSHRYHNHDHWWRGGPWWRYSQAEELNREELQRLGVVP